MAMPVAWSYSRLKTFEECPYKFWGYNVAKLVKEAETEPMRTGKAVHKALELRITQGTPLPAHLRGLEGVCQSFDRARASGREVLAEQQWAFRTDHSRTGWFEKDAWLRVIFDAAVIGTTSALIIDWKTGKRYPDWDQLKLFAAVVLTQYPTVQRVHTSFVWTAQDAEDTEEYDRSDLADLWAELIPRVGRIQSAMDIDHWVKTPSRSCSWCGMKKDKHCEGTV